MLKLRGLDPAAEYALSSIEGKVREGTPAVASGAWWMNHGLEMDARFPRRLSGGGVPAGQEVAAGLCAWSETDETAGRRGA